MKLTLNLITPVLSILLGILLLCKVFDVGTTLAIALILIGIQRILENK